jgi:hypothetical protein
MIARDERFAIAASKDANFVTISQPEKENITIGYGIATCGPYKAKDNLIKLDNNENHILSSKSAGLEIRGFLRAEGSPHNKKMLRKHDEQMRKESESNSEIKSEK